MRTGVLSDIHGNLQALDAVLAVCREMGALRLVCLGDVVGYGGDPTECLDRIRRACALVIAGNHDRAAAGVARDHADMNPLAAAAISWTSARLSGDDRAFLSSLPLDRREEDVLFVHGSPEEPGAFHYIHTAFESERAMAFTDARITFVGHSHRAFVSESARGEVMNGEGSVALREGARYLVNVGSVGQPRDRDPRSAFALWDRTPGRVSLVRVPYDVASAQARILEEGLPPMLAYRLSSGR